MNLDVVKKFKGRNSQPYTIDANENYLVVGYDDWSGSVDVHSRNDLDQNGMYQKITVSNFFSGGYKFDFYQEYENRRSLIYRVIIANDTVYFCADDFALESWSIPNKEFKYEVRNIDYAYDIVIGREGTPLANKMVSIGERSCLISNQETGAKVKKINFHSDCYSIAVDKAQTMIAVGTEMNVTFIETTNFTKVNEVSLNDVFSLAFNKRDDCMLALLGNGEVYSFKF